MSEQQAKAIFGYLEPALNREYQNGAWVYKLGETTFASKEVIVANLPRIFKEAK